MRALTAKQKKIIEKFHDRTNGIFLDEETEEKVAAVNDYETVYMDAARYLSDYATEKINERETKMVKLAIVDKDMNRVVHGFDTLDDARTYMKQYVITPAKDYIAALEEVSTLHIDKIGRKKKHIYPS